LGLDGGPISISLKRSGKEQRVADPNDEFAVTLCKIALLDGTTELPVMGDTGAVIGIIRRAEVEICSEHLSDRRVDGCVTEDHFGNVSAKVGDERVMELVVLGLDEVRVMYARQMVREEFVDDGIMRAKNHSVEQGQDIVGVLGTSGAEVGQCRIVVGQGNVVHAWRRSHGWVGRWKWGQREAAAKKSN
jgi:hypothetical protein